MDLIEGLKKRREEKSKTHGRYAFLKHKEEIKEALNNGYNAIDIWEHLHKKVRCQLNTINSLFTLEN
ncbi:hypothetical protein HAALTHF_23420n [Vreelandella aquamarina]|nr:hypothetical protein HAALTHF_23420n [Halomonas axialensis]